MENDEIIICRTEFDTAKNTMTQFLANGFRVVCDFEGAGTVVLWKETEIVNSFSMQGKTAPDLGRYLMDTALAAQKAK